jgi:glycosyltransferase involved in cell wall biosynthesis
MAAGVPVIATAAGGPLEVIEPGVTGWLVPPGDVAALATALHTLRDDPDLRARLAEAGRVEAERFAPDIIARQVEDLYDLVVRGGSSR